jgi:ParB family chromosome partitioning protein
MSKSSSPKKTKAIPRKRSKCPEPLPVQLIALEKVDPSPLNRDARNIDDLVASVRVHGIQQPIKLRPQGSRFEIVYGERRFRAARKVGLKEIPATVEELSDEEAQEIRIVENICRVDPHPLEEAEAYEELLAMKDDHGEPAHTAETLAKLVGRSAHYVYARLKLTALGTAMREAFRSGELTTTTAFLVARSIPSELQDEALAEFRQIFIDREEGAAFPSQDLACHIEQNYLTRLERAPFGLKDARLVPEAGPCTTCPKRSGNQPVLFTEETPKDTCTDATCFRGKLSAHRKKLADEVLAKGGVVLTEHQSSEIFGGCMHLPWNSKHIDVNAMCGEDPAGRTWRKLLGDLCPKLTLATDPSRVPHALVLKADALAALKQAGVELAQLRKEATMSPGACTGDPSEADDELEENLERDRAPNDPAAARVAAERCRASIRNILGAIVAAAEARSADDATFARLIFDAMAQGGYHDAIGDTVKRRSLDRGKGETAETVLAAHARSLDARGLRALVLELAIARGAYFAWSTKYSERLTAAASAYGVDISSVESTTADEVATRRAERAARKAAKVAIPPAT